MTVSAYEKTIWNYIIKRVSNPYGAAGILGNLYAESGLRPNDLESTAEKRLGVTDKKYVEAVDSGEYTIEQFSGDSAGFGIVQWTYPSRKKALYAFAKERGVSIADLDMQLDFMWKEMQAYKGMMETLHSATDIRTASDAVLFQYERPANQSEAVQQKRASFGKEIFDRNYQSKNESEGGINMSTLSSAMLVADFQKMYSNKWGYIPGTSGQLWTQADQTNKAAADSGVSKYGQKWVGHYVADCSGAFVCAYRKYGLSIYHGSNRIAREYVIKLLPPSQAKPGMAAFKAYNPGDKYYSLPGEYKPGGSHYDGDMKDYYHIGLVDADTTYVLNSASTSSGFKRSKLSDGWCAVGYLKAVVYEGGDVPMSHLYQAEVVAESGNTVNLRKSASTSAARVGTIPVGSIVDVLGEYNADWAEVQYNEKTGYVMRKFLKKIEPSNSGDSRDAAMAKAVEYANEIVKILQNALAERAAG